MKLIIERLANNIKIKQVCVWLIIVFLFLYVFSIPAFSGRPVWYVISYALMGLLGFATVFYTLLYSKISINKWFILPFLFTLFAGVGTIIYSHNFRLWLTLFLMFLTMIIFYYAFIAISDKRKVFKILVLAFLLFAFYFSFVYRNPILHLQLTSARLGTYFDNVNTIGFYFAIGFSLSLYLGLFFERKYELMYIFVSLLFFALGLFTGSRSFLVAVAFVIIFMLFFKLRNHLFIFVVSLSCIIALYFILLKIPRLAFLKDQFDRMVYTLFGIGNSKVDGSTIQRMIWPRYAFYLGAKNLLFGYGCGGFSIYSGVGTYAHNNFAEIMCNFGMIGFVLFNLCYFVPVFLCKRKENDFIMAVLLFVIYFSRSLFGVIYYTKEAYLLFAILFFVSKDYTLSFFVRNRVCFCEVNI